MKVIERLEDFPNFDSAELTIGNFDGVHLGHQALLNRLVETKDSAVVFTFSNHPSSVLRKKNAHWIYPLEVRLALFKKMGIDVTIVTPFTEAFSQQSPEAFLTKLKKHVPFSKLILGHDAAIGHGRSGDPTVLFQLSQKLGFTLEYLEPVYVQGELVSSSRIRGYLENGQFEKAQRLLSRPFSIQGEVTQGAQKGITLGFQTANVPIENLCIPPFGVYAVEVKIADHEMVFAGVANLGRAPTLHLNRKPLLEVHILDFEKDLYGQKIEVIFLKFLREEKKFDSLEKLKKQIHHDIESTRGLFSSVKSTS